MGVHLVISTDSLIDTFILHSTFQGFNTESQSTYPMSGGHQCDDGDLCVVLAAPFTYYHERKREESYCYMIGASLFLTGKQPAM